MHQTTLKRETFGTNLKALLPWLRPRPYTQKIWLDALYLVVIAAIQIAILPSLMPGPMTIDLVTPWLIIGFVRGSILRTICIAILAGLTLETYSGIPAGFYLSTYFVIGTTLFLIRNSLSWHMRLPWFATMVVAQLIVISFEAFVIFLAGMEEVLDLVYVLIQSARLIIGSVFGMYLVDTKWALHADEEANA